jgi:hypothetical protein
MPQRPIWLIDLGTGEWAVSCSRCQLSLFQGAKRHARRVFRDHRCEPSVVVGRRRAVRGGRY